MTPRPFCRRPFALALTALLAAAAMPSAHANDFPTVDRVIYVQECMRAHPGPSFEMTNKCSCAVDRIADEVKYDDFVTMSTVSKAITIGGERGGTIRDAPSLTPEVKRYRDLQAKVEKSCLLTRDGQ